MLCYMVLMAHLQNVSLFFFLLNTQKKVIFHTVCYVQHCMCLVTFPPDNKWIPTYARILKHLFNLLVLF